MNSVSLLSQPAPPPGASSSKASTGDPSAFGKLLGSGERQPLAKDGKDLPDETPDPVVTPAKAGTRDETVAPWLPVPTGTTGEPARPLPAATAEDEPVGDPIVAVAVPLPPPVAAPAAVAPAPSPARPVSPIAPDAAIEITPAAVGNGDVRVIVVARAPSPVAPVSPPAPDARAKAEPAIVVHTPATLPTIVVAPPMLAPVMPRAFRPLVTARAPVIALADPDDAAGPLPGAITTIAAITPSGSAASPTLDMSRADWPATMIDRIDRLRDDANAADTSIRVVPDALGRIHVSLRRDDGGTHVHFAADQAQTRALLADARPQLAELAEARGMRLAQASVGGEPGGQPQPRTPPAAFVPAAPASATAQAGGTTDHRIA